MVLLDHFEDDLHLGVTDAAEDRAMRGERAEFVRRYRDGRWRVRYRDRLVQADIRRRKSVNALRRDERYGRRLTFFECYDAGRKREVFRLYRYGLRRRSRRRENECGERRNADGGNEISHTLSTTGAVRHANDLGHASPVFTRPT